MKLIKYVKIKKVLIDIHRTLYKLLLWVSSTYFKLIKIFGFQLFMWFDLYSSWICCTECLKTMTLCLFVNIASVIFRINHNMLDLFSMFHKYFMLFLFHFLIILHCMFKSGYFLLCYFPVDLFLLQLCLIYFQVYPLVLTFSCYFGFLNFHWRTPYIFQLSHHIHQLVINLLS